MPNAIARKSTQLIEVACRDRQGRPSYRWTAGWVVEVDGEQSTATMTRRDAQAVARRIRETGK